MKLKCCLHMHRKGVPEEHWEHWAKASDTMDFCKDCNLENMVYPKKDSLDEMRSQMHEMEKELMKFGFPERTGFECWNLKDLKLALKKYPGGREIFKKCAELHVRFYMKLDKFEGKIEEFNPHKTDTTARNTVKLFNYLEGLND